MHFAAFEWLAAEEDPKKVLRSLKIKLVLDV